jgi:hypothetical protein
VENGNGVDTQPAGAGRGDDNGDVPLALGHGVPCAPNTEPPACLGAARLCGESQGADGLGWRRKTPARHQMVRVRRYGIECGGRGLLLSNACANLLDRAGKRSDVFDHTGLYTHSVTY